MQTTLLQLPEVGKIYASNIPSAPEIAVRIKVEAMREVVADAEMGVEAGFLATCSYPDEPGAPYLELAPDDWTASGFSLANAQTSPQ